MQPAKAGGFTLVELMVTIAVAGVMLTVAVPSMSSFITGQRVRTAMYDFSAMLMLARSEAIKRNGEVSVVSATGGWINGFVVQAGDTVIARQSAFGNIQVANTDTSVIFTNTGRPKNGASAFQIEKGSDKRCMRISLSGMPVTKAGACA